MEVGVGVVGVVAAGLEAEGVVWGRIEPGWRWITGMHQGWKSQRHL
jgi:hypothetical protein